MKTITHNLLSSQGLQDKILNKFIPKWVCSGNEKFIHNEEINSTCTCKNPDCSRTIFDSKESYKIWLNLALVISVIGIISFPLGGIALLISLKQDINQKQNIIQKAEIDIKSKDQQIQEKLERINTQDQKIQESQQQLISENKKVQQLKKQLTSKNQQIRRLRIKIRSKN
ncbi:coiled-coil domain-containing protein [Aphanizomenon flos-aquae]|uniref:coiled-coil domain-containing protein n=1 Tax=Aphanizomenon flos-aquae TaxID=1176 RepID=UPI000485AE06|nr:hypothetical protein [Aphanizomenon flos-aquae]